MLGLGALFSLSLTTATPDALCPPLDEARSAVRARVGEVDGDFEAEFSLVRDAGGAPSLDLVVRQAGVIRLQRSLPLEGVGCEDAAQAIALVLERYFDTVEARTSPTPDVGPVPVPVESRPALPPVKAHDDAPRVLAPTRRGPPSFELRAGGAQDWEYAFGPSVGVSYYPAGLRWRSGLSLGLAFDAALFVLPTTEVVRGQRLTQSTWETALALPWQIDLARLRLAIGPRAQVRWQRAEGSSLSNGNSRFRALPGVGAVARVVWAVGTDWALGADLAFGAQLTRLSPRFVLRQELGELQPVLVPKAWFGEARLAVSFLL